MAVEMNVQQAASFLQQVAAQSYGSGLLQKTSGGAGSIGMIGGKPVKFNTHWQERGGNISPEMIKSSNELRESLGAAAKGIGISGEQLGDLYGLLGLDGEGKAASNKDLLSRKVAAKALKAIDELRGASSFDGVQAKSSKGIRTSFAARNIEMASDKLGIKLNARQIKEMEACIAGGKAVFQSDVHTKKGLELLRYIGGEQNDRYSSETKDVAAFLNRLPDEKRMNGLFMALAGGSLNVVCGLAMESVLDEVLEHSTSGYADVAALKSWADVQFKLFQERYPKMPTLDYPDNLEQTQGSDRLQTAATLRAVMAIDDAGHSDMLLHSEDADGVIDLVSWRQKGSGQDGVPLMSKLQSNPKFSRILTLSGSCGVDVKDMVQDYRGEQGGFGLSLSSFPKNAMAVNPRMLDHMNVAGDLERTDINAKFKLPNGETTNVATGCNQTGEKAVANAANLEAGVRQLLKLGDKEPLTPQAKVTMAFFTAEGTGPLRDLMGEHVARDMTIWREGEDVLVRLQSRKPPEDGRGTFDYTVRIRPDGTNRYVHIDVSEKPIAFNGPIDQMAHSIVMGVRNMSEGETRTQVEQAMGHTYQQQLEAAKNALMASPKMVERCQFRPLSKDQLEKLDGQFRKDAEALFTEQFPTVNHTGLGQDMVRSMVGDLLRATTVQGEGVPPDAPMKNADILQLNPDESWGPNPPAKAAVAMLERLATIVPEDDPNRKELTFLLTMNMGLIGPIAQLGGDEFKQVTGLPSIVDNMSSEDVIKATTCSRYSWPVQDVSRDGNDLVLTQRYTYTPNCLIMKIGKADVPLGMLASPTSMLPSMTFVTTMRVPLNQNLKEGTMPNFTITTKLEE